MGVGESKGVAEGRVVKCDDGDPPRLGHIGRRKRGCNHRSSFLVFSRTGDFGITITKLSKSFIYQVQGGSVVATKSCVASCVNFNIAVALSEDTSRWTQGFHGICETAWCGNILFRGFGVRFDKIQHLEGDARGVYSK